MLSFSLNEIARRGTWTCLSCSNLPWSCQALIASSSRPLLAKTHQRKHSSSKHSSPPKDIPRPPKNVPNPSKDASRAIDAPSKTRAKEAISTANQGVAKRPGARVGRRKTRDALPDVRGKNGYETLFNITQVPSTQHLHLRDINVASFFSFDRPISVTTSFPPISSSSAFSSIFDRKAHQKPRQSDVIHTLSSALDRLNSQSQQTPSEEFDYRTTMFQEDSSESVNGSQSPEFTQPTMLHVNMQELVRHFRPFVPPPPPEPMVPVEKKPTVKSYSAVLTILESTQPNGTKIYQTRTSPIREDPTAPADFLEDGQVMEMPVLPRQPFLNHMRERQRRWEEIRNGNGKRDQPAWCAISVKRQRKLKMKKHKYKKLMRRTRNLRRRLDRN